MGVKNLAATKGDGELIESPPVRKIDSSEKEKTSIKDVLKFCCSSCLSVFSCH